MADESTVTGGSGVYSGTVSIDVTSFAGWDTLLAFDVLHGLDPDYNTDGMDTTVALDFVNISVIPAPGALLLGSIGIGCISYLRRRKTI